MSAFIFDAETTGMEDPVRLVEAAWLKIASPLCLEKTDQMWCGRFNPGKQIELGALATHHILDEELIQCPSWEEFSLPADCQYLVGHNVDYDWKVVGCPDVKRIDTKALATWLLPELDSRSQSALVYHFSSGNREVAREMLRNAHSAMGDVDNLRFVLGFLLRLIFERKDVRIPDDLTWEDVWGFSEKARVPTIMPFGKHKGMPIKDVPADYKAWLLRQNDVDPYLVKALSV